jgi:hypothetical protein
MFAAQSDLLFPPFVQEYILQELQTLASRVDGVVQEVSQVKQVQAALEALIRGSTTAPGLRPLKVPASPKKKPVQKKKAPTPTKEAESQQILPVENVDSDSMYDWPPIKTVEDCWKEMYEGLEGRPSLMSLEERYGSAWRRKKGQRQRFCEKKQVRGPLFRLLCRLFLFVRSASLGIQQMWGPPCCCLCLVVT